MSLLVIALFILISFLPGIIGDEGTDYNSDFSSETNTSEFNVDFNVKNNNRWVKEIERPVQTILTFKINVSGSYGAYLTVTAVLPEMLTLVNASPQPHEVKTNEYGSKNIYWYYDQFKNAQNFYFNAKINLNQTKNCLATSVLLLPFKSDNETVKITGSSQQPPSLVADANGPYKGNVSEKIIFTGSGQGGVKPYKYHWTFGDGTVSRQKYPTHTYFSANNFTAVLTVTDARNVSAKNETKVIIKEKNEQDNVNPSINIIKPLPGIYLFNKKVLPFSKPVVIGQIEIMIVASDNESGISHIHIYKDDSLVVNISQKPYLWEWTKISFGRSSIQAYAFDHAGNSATTDEIKIVKLF